MSERTIRIPAEALAQRLNRIEERVRALSLRAWPGAVRSAASGTEITVTPIDTPVTLVSLTAEPGRWVAIGHVQLGVGPTAAGRFSLRAYLEATNAEGVRVDLDNPVYDLPGRIAYQNGLSTSSTVAVPMTVIGHFVSEEIITISLTANNVDLADPDVPLSVTIPLDPFLARDASLLLVPA